MSLRVPFLFVLVALGSLAGLAAPFPANAMAVAEAPYSTGTTVGGAVR